MLTLFAFPDPKDTAPVRSVTVGPLQRLFFLNNSFVIQQAEALAKRLQADAGPGRESSRRQSLRTPLLPPTHQEGTQNGAGLPEREPFGLEAVCSNAAGFERVCDGALSQRHQPSVRPGSLSTASLRAPSSCLIVCHAKRSSTVSYSCRRHSTTRPPWPLVLARLCIRWVVRARSRTLPR